MITEDDIKTAQSTPFFGSLPTPIRDRVFAQGRVLDAKAGEMLFQQGERAKTVYAILSGLVKLSAIDKDGHETVVEVFRNGDSFAEALVFGAHAYPVSATTLVDSRVLAVPNKVVRNAIGADSEAFGAILSATYMHVHRLVRQIEQLKSNSGAERIAQYILARAPKQTSVQTIEIPFEKQVLASLLGMQPETLSRAFRKLNKHGVSLKGRQIRLHDIQALKNFLSPS